MFEYVSCWFCSSQGDFEGDLKAILEGNQK